MLILFSLWRLNNPPDAGVGKKIGCNEYKKRDFRRHETSFWAVFAQSFILFECEYYYVAFSAIQLVRPKEFSFEDFEVQLKGRVQKEFRNHDPEWKHTLEVVKNMKRLVTMEGGKLDILVCCAYFHELGHIGVTEGSTVFSGKPIYAQRGYIAAKKAREILSGLTFGSQKTEEVAVLLESNTCLELKRAHHVLD